MQAHSSPPCGEARPRAKRARREGSADALGMRSPQAVGGLELARSVEDWIALIRIGVSAWRVGPRPQPSASRRTIAATSSSGTPTGHAAAAAARSGVSPETSGPAAPRSA